MHIKPHTGWRYAVRIATCLLVSVHSTLTGSIGVEASVHDRLPKPDSVPTAVCRVKVVTAVPFAPKRESAKPAKVVVRDAIQPLKSATEVPILTNESPEVKASIGELRRRHLLIPVDGVSPELMKGSFYQGRVGHKHNAVDLVAPRGTPIRAADDGKIARLHNSAAGGITIYQTDPAGRFVYYYAHLERYETDLKEGADIRRNQVIGYVGTSGNAPPNTPHLHFQICRLDQGSVFKGTPIDPYEVFRTDASNAKLTAK